MLSRWASSYREAYAQGQAGFLEPNEVVQPDNEVQSEVPDLTIRHYFLRNDDPDKADEVQALVRRLQRMDVEVRQLTEPLAVPDYAPYGRAAGATTLPAGTFWVPMAQAQKHWVQAMLNEDTYTPFPYFYDVTAWSQPLLFNVDGGRSGAQLDPAWQPAPAFDEPEVELPTDRPTVGLWQMSSSTSAVESSGWLRWLFERKWGLAYQDLTTQADQGRRARRRRRPGRAGRVGLGGREGRSAVPASGRSATGSPPAAASSGSAVAPGWPVALGLTTATL